MPVASKDWEHGAETGNNIKITSYVIEGSSSSIFYSIHSIISNLQSLLSSSPSTHTHNIYIERDVLFILQKERERSAGPDDGDESSSAIQSQDPGWFQICTFLGLTRTVIGIYSFIVITMI